MVYDQGKREGERNECEACQGRGRQLADAGGARARVTEVAGERRRRGPTVQRVPDAEAASGDMRGRPEAVGCS